MTSTVQVAASAQQASNGDNAVPQTQNREPGGNVGGGRGGRIETYRPLTLDDGLRDNRRWRGGNRGNQGDGNKDQRRQTPSGSANYPAPPLPPPLGPGGGGSFGGRLTKDAATKEGEVLAKGHDGEEEDTETEVCFICASPVVYTSVAPCNHRTCHICALRLRALYKTRACAHCRTEAKYVVFTDDATKRYEEFVDVDINETDEMLGIKYQQKEIHDDTVLLLRYNCPDFSCDIACWGWSDLHRHVKSVHQKIMCDLCTRNKKVFTHEHELFTIQHLRKHEKFGDDNPGAVDQSGFKGHPECGFCRERFYGDDELYVHCREKHEKCYICDRRNHERQQQYYINYNSLEQHFRKDHFSCADQECMDKKFVVFESEMDLQAHQLEAHPNGLSKDARKDARRVDISTFDYRTPHQDQGGRREREGRGRGRGRDPNTEPLPQSTTQPLRRDELAYQRQLAIQSAQSITPRTFGGSLTSANTHTAMSNGRDEERTVTASRESNMSNLSLLMTEMSYIDSSRDLPASRESNAPTSSLPIVEGEYIDLYRDLYRDLPRAAPAPAATQVMTPQEQARHLQHNAVMDRATTMLKNNQTKLAGFRNSVSSYRSSSISPRQLVDNFFPLFDVPVSEFGKLIKELADIYENPQKRNDLLKAWNDWRAINGDYPPLHRPIAGKPSSSSSTAIPEGVSGGYRVLQLKRSTAQSSQSAVSKQRSWDNAALANPFPCMPPPSSPANRAGMGRVGTTPGILPSVPPSSTLRPSPVSSRPTSRARQPVQSDAFPALPAAKKPNTMIFGLTGGNVRWDDRKGNGNGNGTPNAWGVGSGAGSAKADAGVGKAEAEVGGGEGEGVQGGNKKGGKGKKQVLMRFG